MIVSIEVTLPQNLFLKIFSVSLEVRVVVQYLPLNSTIQLGSQATQHRSGEEEGKQPRIDNRYLEGTRLEQGDAEVTQERHIYLQNIGPHPRLFHMDILLLKLCQ